MLAIITQSYSSTFFIYLLYFFIYSFNVLFLFVCWAKTFAYVLLLINIFHLGASIEDSWVMPCIRVCLSVCLGFSYCQYLFVCVCLKEKFCSESFFFHSLSLSLYYHKMGSAYRVVPMLTAFTFPSPVCQMCL